MSYLYIVIFAFYIVATLLLWFFIKLSYGVFQIKVNYFIPSIHCLAVNKKEVLLTFDDGPDEKQTLEILNVLKEYQIKSVFFCIGNKVEKYPEIVKQLLDEGHVIGNHTYSHSPWWGFYATKACVEEIKRFNKVMQKHFAYQTTLFRPPFGITNPNIAKAVRFLNLTSMGWSVRSFDTVLSPEKVQKRVVKQVKPGAIVLLHDTTKGIALLLENIIKELKSEGYEFIDYKNYSTSVADNVE